MNFSLQRTISKSSNSVYIKEINKLDKIIESNLVKLVEEEYAQRDELLEEDEEEELEDIEAAIAEMKSLIRDQNVSKASRFP